MLCFSFFLVITIAHELDKLQKKPAKSLFNCMMREENRKTEGANQ
jgi:hypothetical protein